MTRDGRVTPANKNFDGISLRLTALRFASPVGVNIGAWEPMRRTEGTRTKRLKNRNSQSKPSKTPGYQISSKSDNFSFQSLSWGLHPPPQNLSLFWRKNGRTKILSPIFVDSAPSKGTRNRLTAKSDHS